MSLQQAIAQSLRAHRRDYPEACEALDSMTQDLADVLAGHNQLGASQRGRESFRTAAGYYLAPASAAADPDRAPVPGRITDALARADRALNGDSPGIKHDTLEELAELIRDLYAVPEPEG